MLFRIARKNAWLFVVAGLSVLPFLLSAGYSLLQLSTSNQAELTEQLLARANGTAKTVDQRLSSSVAALNALASSPAAQRNDLRALYEHALRVIQSMPEARAVTLVDREGQMRFFTLRPWGSRLFAANDQLACQRVFDNGLPVASEPFVSPVSNRYVVAIGVPVFQKDQVAYCLRMILLTESLNELLTAQRFPQDWVASIVSAKGRLISRSRGPELFVGQTASEEVLTAKMNHVTGLFDAHTMEGDWAKAVLVPVGRWDWSVAVGVPHTRWQESTWDVHILLATYGGGFGLMGVLMTIWGLYFFRQRLGLGEAEAFRNAPASTGSLWPALLAMGLALGLGSYSAWQAQQGFQQIVAAAEQRQMLHRQRLDIMELLSMFKDIESGQRGFVITGNDSFLQPYNVAMQLIPERTASLREAFEQTGVRDFNWTEFNALSAERILSASQSIARRRQLGPAAVREDTSFTDAKFLMDKLRLKLGDMDTRLDGRVRQINQRMDEQRKTATHRQWFAAFAVGTLLMLSVAIWLNERRRRLQINAELIESNATLESRVKQRTRDLAQANQRIRAFALETQDLLDAERKRLSREVHDQIGQIFTGIKMIARTLKPGSLDPAQQVALMNAVESGVRISRRIAAELRPPLLDDFGLRTALEHLVKSLCEPAGLNYSLSLPEVQALSKTQTMQLFRMIQEACTNVLRHAHAQHLELHGLVLEDAFEVCIDDDGQGFDPSQQRPGALGLMGMRERANLIHAQLHIEALTPRGTRVRIRLPLAAPAVNLIDTEVRADIAADIDKWVARDASIQAATPGALT